MSSLSPSIKFSVKTTLSCLVFVSGGALAQSEQSSVGLQLDTTSPHRFAPVMLDTDSYAGHLTQEVRADDIGDQAQLYAAALYEGNWYLKTATGWQAWDASFETLAAYSEVTLGSDLTFNFFEDTGLPAGDYALYAAYQVADEPLVLMDVPMNFAVQAATEDRLHRFEGDAALENFLKESMATGASSQSMRLLESVAATDSASASAGPIVSGTNVQEVGVDEADIVKSDGEHLYLLRNCGVVNCIATVALDATAATAEEVGLYQPETDKENFSYSFESLYLVTDRPEGNDLLVALAGQNYAVAWLDVWNWAGNRVDIELLDATDPTELSLATSLSLDGNLISSRRIGDTLYLVTRYTPFIDNFVPTAFDSVTQQSNTDALGEASLSDLLPALRIDGQDGVDLVRSERCYLATGSVDRGFNPSMITVTSIPLADPAAFSSTCFLGNTESVYMTTESLYLATTQYPYTVLAADALVYDPTHETAVHKFDLGAGDVDYRGSGQVRGHLGWSEDKRSFRMGERGDYLNIATSVGDSWGPSSSTRLTVLKEADGRLETVDVIDGIGKPGERLYAARFIGDRAYLVTFRVIDPLYVIDLSDQDNPRIAGELEIDGYSDYLHPISDDLLLGIGKDAVPDDGSSDFGFTRGAWYQGVKLSLFDVSDPAAPSELDSMVFGKRGSESEVLYDHHGIAFLPATDSRPARFAIPVQINETEPDNEFFDPEDPSAWYSFTSKGLHNFEASAEGLELVSVIEGDSTEEVLTFRFISPFGDRSVLVDDAVFYVHEGEVRPALWGQ